MKLKRILSAFLAALMLASVCMTGIVSSAETDLPFSDVKDDWTYEYIKYVYETGLMNGVGDGSKFAPNDKLTRAMVVTVLYRNNGSPAVDFKDVFLDVKDNKYYSDAAVWAYENEIVNGTHFDDWGDPYFSPDAFITRQELATMFMRYAKYMHVITDNDRADLSVYPDNGKVAKDWALEAVQWAVKIGLINGKSDKGVTTLDPRASASRAEFAAIIQRYNKKVTDREFSYELVYETPVLQSSYTAPEYPLVKDADIYVAVDGNDSNKGSLEEPIATFEKAVEMVRGIKDEMLKNGEKGEIKVAFKGGDYGVLDNLTFTEADSGTADIPITYCAYGDSPVYFTNGVFIEENEFKPLDESDKALFNEEFANDIKKVDLSDDPSADKIGTFTNLSNDSGFCWQARTPNKVDGVDKYYPGFSYFALLPDSPLTYDELVYHNNIDFSAAETDSHLYQDRFYVIHLLKEKLDTYDTYDNVQLAGYISKVWHQDVFTITSYDKETGLVTYDGRPPWGFYALVGGQTQIYVNNASKELDDKGEYFIDPNTKILYVYDPEGTYTIATNDTFVTIDSGAKHIGFTNLNFRTCKGTGMYVYADNFTMDQCTIMYVGGTHAFKSDGTINMTITNSEFAYCSESGVSIEGPTPGEREDFDYYALQPTGLLFENNLIHDVDMASIPVESGALIIRYQIEGQVSHNEIYNSARYGIDFKYGNIDCVMEYNYLHHCMQNSADGGAFYAGRTATNRGNIIRYNLISDIYALNPIHQGGTYAIYLDDGHENLICYSNVFYNSGSIMNNNGSRHEIYDNVFIKKSSGIVGKSGVWDISQYSFDEWDEGWNDIRRIPAKDTPNGKIWLEKWPELYDILAICEDPTCYKETDLYKTPLNYCHNNYCFDGASHNFFDEWIEYSDHKNNNSYASDKNPIFTDPTHGDYSIKEGSGFADNHFDKIGRY